MGCVLVGYAVSQSLSTIGFVFGMAAHVKQFSIDEIGWVSVCGV